MNINIKTNNDVDHDDDCKVTNCSPNPKEIRSRNGPNKPNTINL